MHVAYASRHVAYPPPILEISLNTAVARAAAARDTVADADRAGVMAARDTDVADRAVTGVAAARDAVADDARAETGIADRATDATDRAVTGVAAARDAVADGRRNADRADVVTASPESE